MASSGWQASAPPTADLSGGSGARCLVIDQAAILAEIPFGRKTLQVVEGGITVPAIFVEQFGDKNEEVVAVLAAVALSVDIA